MQSSFSALTQNKIFVALVIIALGLVAMGLVAILKGQEPVQLEIISATSEAESSMIWVDVAGAVTQPGVYQLTAGSRLKDALIAAGGLTESADRPLIAKTVNLAATIEDGAKVYFASHDINDVQDGVSQTTSNLINLNTSSAEQLQSLEGIGPARAGAIIAGRPYSRVEDLKAQKIIPESVYLKIADLVTVW